MPNQYPDRAREKRDFCPCCNGYMDFYRCRQNHPNRNMLGASKYIRRRDRPDFGLGGFPPKPPRQPPWEISLAFKEDASRAPAEMVPIFIPCARGIPAASKVNATAIPIGKGLDGFPPNPHRSLGIRIFHVEIKPGQWARL